MVKNKRRALAKKLVKLKREEVTKEQFLELIIGISKAAISSRKTGIDEFFEEQVVRLTKELEELKNKNS